jgi:hypothetical protein
MYKVGVNILKQYTCREERGEGGRRRGVKGGGGAV